MSKFNFRYLLLLVVGFLCNPGTAKAKLPLLSSNYLLGSFSTTLAVRSMEAEEKVISYGENITINEKVTEEVSWTIKNVNTNLTVAFGTGDSLLRYIFEIPGNYQIDIQESHQHDPDECNHSHLPQQIMVKVGSVRMKYEMSSLVLSKEIIGGQETDGTTLIINAFVEVFDNVPKTFSFQTFTSAGVNTTIIGTLTNPDFVLNNGLNTLEFYLSGTAQSSSYIMFDFKDYNGNVQCYYLINPIK